MLLHLLALAACTPNDATPEGSVTVELSPSSATLRPGHTVEFEGFVRGTSRWDTATCTVDAGTCTLHFVVAQQFRVVYEAPLMLGTVTLTLAHDGSGGAPDEPAVPASASATITVDGPPPVPPSLAVAWQDASNGVYMGDSAFSSDGSRFVAVNRLDFIASYDWATGKTLAAWQSPPADSVAFAADDEAVLVGSEPEVMRLDLVDGSVTARIALDLPTNQAPYAVHDIVCSPTAPVCAAVRGPIAVDGSPCSDCVSGVFLLDDTGGSTPTVRQLAVSTPAVSWDRVAWSPDGAWLAVLDDDTIRSQHQIVSILNPTTAVVLAQIDTNVPANPINVDPLLAWTDADTIETNTGVWRLSTGERVGNTMLTGSPGVAYWNHAERYSFPRGDSRFQLVDAAQPAANRGTVGVAGLLVDLTLAREAPYLYALADVSIYTDFDLDVYDVTTGERLAELPRSNMNIGAPFDVCADGTVVYLAPDGTLAVASPPSFTSTPLVVDGETLLPPIYALPDSGSTCRILASSGLERSVAVDVRTGQVVKQLPFAARKSDASLTRFLQAGTLFAPTSRVLDDQGNLVFTLAGACEQWGDEPLTGRFYGLDVDGTLRFWDWTGPVEERAIVERDEVVLLPRQLWGPLALVRGTGTQAGQIHFFEDDGTRRVMDVSLGYTPLGALMYVPDEDVYVLGGFSLIRALEGEAVRTRLAESPVEVDP